ncbi:ABC transporter substrate-binding protein [Frankia sp. CeD]|uniref:ABC transporter substrate-binding protein n=1 Tax=Frankia sp. CeD TaxID=258230 RepID=UPI0004DD28CC|nr:ABC transporter substrate-binding protein [Frankia sp. CeD]KEZ35430.1 ABC-type Fe3+-hydroxamate transport system, periplasmic component [Frankia sp. CeD]
MKKLGAGVAVAALLVVTAGLTGCGSGSTTGAGSASAADARSAPAGTRYPVEVANCGRTLHFDEAPARVVSGWTTSTELLIELGLTDRIVGQYNTSSGTPAAKYASAEAKLPALGTGAPTREALLAARPDLIWADGSYLFDGRQLPTIAELAAQGTQVMILSGFCTDDATKATVRDVDTDLTALGMIFGIPGRARQVQADINERLRQVATKIQGRDPVPVAVVATYQGTVYTYDGVYTDIARLAGARNIYAGTLPKGKYFSELSVEDLISKNPGTLVYLLSGSETEAEARKFLTSRLPTVAAVRNNRVFFLPQSDSANLAGVEGVTKLAAALHA